MQKINQQSFNESQEAHILILAQPNGQAIKTRQNWIEFASLSKCTTFCLTKNMHLHQEFVNPKKQKRTKQNSFMWIHSKHSNTHKFHYQGKTNALKTWVVSALIGSFSSHIFHNLPNFILFASMDQGKNEPPKKHPSDWKFASRQINPQYNISFKLASLIFSTSSWDKRVLLLLLPALSYGWAIFLRNWTERQTIINITQTILYMVNMLTYILY